MEDFVVRIKQKYQERLINREKQWPPCNLSKLIRLQLVERRKGENYLGNQPRGKDCLANQPHSREAKNTKWSPIPYDELFQGMKPIRKILVEGDAGIGKTTLTVSLSENWANEKLFQQFELVLLLPLRLNKIASAASLHELLEILHPSHEICDEVAKYLHKEEGKGTLIIADGWDELSKTKQLEDSFLYNLLFESLPFLSVIVTSRPFSSAPLHGPYIDRFIEIHGFDEDDIKGYILSEFSDNQAKAENLLKQLENNPLVKNVCSIPISCAIVCHLWHITEEILPTSLTELYTKIILNIILRNIKKIDRFKYIKSIHSFNDIPADLQDWWWLLCKFALHSMQNDQIVFFQKELIGEFSLDLAANTNCFGLLQSADSIVETGCETSFHFLHLTFQEYLAALYLVKQLSGIKLDLLFRQIPQFYTVWRFFFGIHYRINQANDSQLVVQLYLRLISAVIRLNPLFLCQCAFEANNEDFLQALTDSEHFKFDTNLVPFTSHDCDVLLYIIANLQQYDGMVIDLLDTCNETQIETLTDLLACKKGKLKVKTLSLQSSELTDKMVMNLFHKASTALCSLEYLFLDDNQIGCEAIKAFTLSVSSNLLELDLSYNPLGVSGLQVLRDIICGGVLANLRKLHLQESLSNDESTDKEFVECLSNCPLLMEVNFSDNNLTSSIMMTLARGSQIQSIIISESRLGDHGLLSFMKCLNSQYYINKLDVQGNDIHGGTVSCLADCIDSGRIVALGALDSCFCFDDNPLGLEGTIAVGRMLCSTHNKHKSLSLSRCQLTVGDLNPHDNQLLDTIGGGALSNSLYTTNIVGQSLFQLPKNTYILKLELDGNRFSGGGIHVLAGLLYLCSCLERLSSKDCEINSCDLQQLFKQLKDTPCSKLQHWNLDDNNINEDGITLLINHLSLLFPQLGSGAGGIYLGPSFCGNPISYKMRRRFVDEIIERHYVSIM